MTKQVHTIIKDKYKTEYLEITITEQCKNLMVRKWKQLINLPKKYKFILIISLGNTEMDTV